MANITNFGKALRRMRLDTDESITQMAKRLGFSTSFLSAVELGKKSVPPEMVSRLQAEYSLDQENVDELISMASETLNTVRINAESHSNEARQTLFALARVLPEMDDDDMRRLRDSVNGIFESKNPK